MFPSINNRLLIIIFLEEITNEEVTSTLSNVGNRFGRLR